MNDDFLSQYHNPPRAEFASTLYDRISRETRMSLLPIRSTSAKMRVAWAGAVVWLLFATMLVVSPEVRAQTGESVRKIGEMIFRDTSPSLPSLVREPARVLVGRGMTLEEARKVVPFELRVPTWARQDYVFSGQVEVTHLSDPLLSDLWRVSMVWQKPLPPDNPGANLYMANQVYLQIAQPPLLLSVTDLTTLEELTINGRPTALLGVWGPVPAEPRNQRLSKGLQWTQGNLSYLLMGGSGVSLDDLIRMAGTIP